MRNFNHFNVLINNFHMYLTADPPKDLKYVSTIVRGTQPTASLYSHKQLLQQLRTAITAFRTAVPVQLNVTYWGTEGVKNKRYNSRVPFEGCCDQRCEDLRQQKCYAKCCCNIKPAKDFPLFIFHIFIFCPIILYFTLFYVIYIRVSL